MEQHWMKLEMAWHLAYPQSYHPTAISSSFRWSVFCIVSDNDKEESRCIMKVWEEDVWNMLFLCTWKILILFSAERTEDYIIIIITHCHFIQAETSWSKAFPHPCFLPFVFFPLLVLDLMALDLAQWSYVQHLCFESGAPAVFPSKQICGFKCIDTKSLS
jgi:hypothetical protein